MESFVFENAPVFERMGYVGVHLKSQKHVRCETRGFFFDVQIVLQNILNEADGVLLAKLNSVKQ